MRELWTPNRAELKTMTDDLMAQRMGKDWGTYWDPTEEQYRLKTMVDMEAGTFLMTAGELPTDGGAAQAEDNTWAGTTTAALYRDAWGTALLDAGRELLKSYIANRRFDSNFNDSADAVRECRLIGPGLDSIPVEAMKDLYEQLHGWELGIQINEACVLIPEKSFGGWFEQTKKDAAVDRKPATCHPGTGCQFCTLKGTKQCRQHRRNRVPQDLTKGEIQLPEDVRWETERTNEGYGVAFDIGTTTMAAMLWNLSSKAVTPITSLARKNPLTVYGRDVISRIHTTGGDSQRIKKMQRELVEAMNRMMQELVEKAKQMSGESAEESYKIGRLSAVGNPTMMHFLFGKDPSGLAAAPFRGEDLPLEIPADAIGLTGKETDDELPVSKNAVLRTLPIMGGHLGADAAAALLAARLPEERESLLLVDVGTNGELLLTDGLGRLWGCSTAAGPAFEGGSITPGSKFIDAAASMLEQGWMDEEGLVLRPMLLSQEEIRQLQLAKSAVRTGVELLQTIAGVSRSEILLTGTFGSHIKPKSAVKIGLLPEGVEIHSAGNLAGVGASLILLSDEEWEQGIAWTKTVTHVELAEEPGFEEAFVRNMDFR